jgi:ferredoxin-NADP reductase
MVERAARPTRSSLMQVVTRVGRNLTTPLLPDDYFGLINPAWSKRELRGTIVGIRRETANVTTVALRPNAPWSGHLAGQYLRVGVDLDGSRHWRAYTLTSDPDHPGGLLSITVKRVPGGVVSPWFVDHAQLDDTVYLGEAEGTFVLPDRPAAKILMITAGSGVTPIWSLMREGVRRGFTVDVVQIHCCHDAEDFIFLKPLERAADKYTNYTLHPHYRTDQQRLRPEDLDTICPDWRERETYLSGPGGMLDTFTAYWDEQGDRDLLHLERFQPAIGGDNAVAPGEGGEIRFRLQGISGVSDGRTSILQAAEDAGGQLPYGCRMGVCHTCQCELVSGKVRDLRTGEVHGEAGQSIRTCVNAPEGPVEINEGNVVIKGTSAHARK